MLFGGAEEVFGCFELTSHPYTATAFLVYYPVMTVILLVNLTLLFIPGCRDIKSDEHGECADGADNDS